MANGAAARWQLVRWSIASAAEPTSPNGQDVSRIAPMGHSARANARNSIQSAFPPHTPDLRGGPYRTDGFHVTTRWPKRNRNAATSSAAFAWKK
jgi:hypothetical protein